MNFYQEVSTVIALGMYLPLAWQILRGQFKQNIATWILWGLMDIIAAVSIFVQGGNWYLPAAYTAGSVVTVACMIRARNVAWTMFETFVSFMVLISVIGWMLSGPWMATILSTTGLVLATFPQIKDAFLRPFEMPLLVYVGYTIANVVATMGGKAWTVEERLYSFSAAACCAMIVGASSRRFFFKSVV